MKIAITGTGNVGWGLAVNISQHPSVSEVFISSRSQDRVTALTMELASVSPEAAIKIRYTEPEEFSEADIVVLTSGVQMVPGQTADDVRTINIEITRTILKRVGLKPSAILILLATPVDDITVFAQALTRLPQHQVFGFGGDLDRNRLDYILRCKSIGHSECQLVGEHGRNAIPIYQDESNYQQVAQEVRGFLRTITALSGETRNLSTVLLLTKLLCSIIENSAQAHYLCGYHPAYDIYLTWKFIIGRSGIVSIEKILVSGLALDDLTTLISRRQLMTNKLTLLD
jgi:malate/lactate dehydrogenase